MQSKLATFLVAAALLSQGAGAAAKTQPSWMVGKWARVDLTDTIRPGDCPEAEFYGRNGYVTYAEPDGVDRWSIDCNYLILVVVEPMGGEPPSAVGRVHKQRFTRTHSGELIFKGDGWAQKLVRCGDVPPDWEYRTGK